MGSILFAASKSSSIISDMANFVSSSVYGVVCPAGYGIYKVAGNIIYASQIRQNTVTTTQSGGKGGGQSVSSTTITYSVDMAVAFATVPPHRLDPNNYVYTTTETNEDNGEPVDFTDRSGISGILRVWFNNQLVIDERTDQPLPPTTIDNKVYTGLETQTADPTMQANLGAANVPAYRGTAFVMFPNLDITNFDGQMPNVVAEVYATLDRVDSLEEGVEGICIDVDGDLWVTSDTARVIQRVNTTNLAVIARPGRDDAPPGQYIGDLPAHPWRCHASADGQYIWIVHRTWNQLTRVSRADNTYTSFTTHKFGQDLGVDLNGNVWVTYPFSNLVRKYDSSGNYLTSITVTDAPWCVTVNPTTGYLWVSGNKKVTVINPTTNSIVATTVTGRYFHGNAAFQNQNTDVWILVTGEDMAALLKNNTYGVRRFRAVGTFPMGIDLNQNDPYGTVFISTFLGNEMQTYDFQVRSHYKAGLISFPGQCAAQADGAVWVTNTKIGVVQRVETR